MIGRILENKEYKGKAVSDYFKTKIEDEKLQCNIERSSEAPTDVILTPIFIYLLIVLYHFAF